MILNAFPDLLTYGILSPFILRIVLGFIAMDLGLLKLGKENHVWVELFQTINFQPSRLFVKLLAGIEIIGGIMLVLGSYTQITAIVFSIVFFCETVLEYREESLETRSLPFYIMMFAISLSLIFSGAGAFALDIGL